MEKLSGLKSDILALREESKILGRCWDVLKVVTCLQSSLWASPHRPTQCSKTGLKMSDWKCEILTEPSNGQESYSPLLEQGYLVATWMVNGSKNLEGIDHLREPPSVACCFFLLFLCRILSCVPNGEFRMCRSASATPP